MQICTGLVRCLSPFVGGLLNATAARARRNPSERQHEQLSAATNGRT